MITKQLFDELKQINKRPKVGYSHYAERLIDLGLVEQFHKQINEDLWFLAYRITEKGKDTSICSRCLLEKDYDRCPSCFETTKLLMV